MASDEVRCVVPAGDRCGEAAVWSAAERCIWWCDINRFLIHRHEPESGATRSWFFDEPVTALSLTSRADTLLVAMASHLILWRPQDDRREPMGIELEGYPEVRFNDGRASPRGDFWIGSMKNNVLPDGDDGEAAPGHGKLFRVRDGRAETVLDGIGIANTLCWSPDRATFYFGDTLANRIDAFDYDARTGDIGPPRAHLQDHERGLPDGSAIDAEGHLWNCRYGGGCVLRVAPDGTVARVLEMPVTDITTCTFGGPDLRTLFITTAGTTKRPGERLAGGLFAVDVDVPGLPENAVTL